MWASFVTTCCLLLLLVSVDPVKSGMIPTSSQAIHINSDCSVVKMPKRVQINGCFRVIDSFPVCKGSCYSTDGLEGLIVVKDSRAKVLTDTCQCCTPSSFKMKRVQLRCGMSWQGFNLILPNSCSCKRCSDGEAGKLTDKRRRRKKKF